MVTPLDIRRKEFKRSVRGYLEEDVDVFLDAVADEVERISKNAELQERVKSLEEQVEGHAVSETPWRRPWWPRSCSLTR